MGLDSAFDGYGLGLSSGGVTQGLDGQALVVKSPLNQWIFRGIIYDVISGSMGLEEGPS